MSDKKCNIFHTVKLSFLVVTWKHSHAQVVQHFPSTEHFEDLHLGHHVQMKADSAVNLILTPFTVLITPTIIKIIDILILTLRVCCRVLFLS